MRAKMLVSSYGGRPLTAIADLPSVPATLPRGFSVRRLITTDHNRSSTTEAGPIPNGGGGRGTSGASAGATTRRGLRCFFGLNSFRAFGSGLADAGAGFLLGDLAMAASAQAAWLGRR